MRGGGMDSPRGGQMPDVFDDTRPEPPSWN